MILIKQADILHKFELQKLLIAIIDDQFISQNVYFKGGTCAEMSGFLDRFSIDLDFDIRKDIDKRIFRLHIDKIVTELDLTDQNKNIKSLFFNFKYRAPENHRNTLKLSFYDDAAVSNSYETRFLSEIDRAVECQTIETMFANKLVAPIDRHNRHNKVVGRDIYDIHYFFSQGYKFKQEIIEERTGLETGEYIKSLIVFIDEKVTEKILKEDLNTLLPYEKFQKIRKVLKQEVLMFLKSCF
ncbi:hypothetical protein A2422_03765 [Candidatus Woesebacteria bacterium RIFOXYC1_FULL_31_51]|uniref:Nucleotidyl transferase AbiEii/AbiGii toxin family protein n=1 Tax=Candidatus Woesebacteria bacterium GW2011_GWC2_31_9 TaxID=1618586 RepID=A0A0G0AXD1_9BACT|nr:MAG: hypothetical protein UR17_C0001G0488 [Candidatus Woesebacteria bacterium GW2011_GWF1_31_35]KKP23042.1 MAG: hypothetical protein UR11_C0001G0016 [Candidatus Woesebacteria bacterium GW2011_GWC1_30_29]KKP25332.1 MAG: hypothetical protein UR13_C0009G0016 [Candidatus Woesebacteria bacterium GW2011_GWD1_31_12]KKP27284.1 MAG: hypothetical protein UR16_C0004G0016 [Candidatus Woesebacteria bacterium GW2011_GWB1_31_29]KKP30869.1 MAG: hypothetical protein UR20_C0049G0004 [Candidatus Woesebacteria 